MATLTVLEGNAPAPRKKLIRRAARDRSQQIRHTMQWIFLTLNIWVGVQFYLWVRYFERGGHGLYIPRPGGVEGWLPIAGLMNAKYFLSTGSVPAIHPAAMFLLTAFVFMSVLLKRAFCSWLCPLGAVSERLWLVGRRILGRTFRIPRWADIPLRGLKYLLLGLFLFAIGAMSAGAIEEFMYTPYGIVADVKMLNFFREISLTASIVVIALALLSVLVQNFWCRYLCPYGALMGLASLLSPFKIRRDAEACIDCARCARSCPAELHVDKLANVYSAECAACMECIAVCPAEGALHFALPPRRFAAPTRRWHGRAAGPAAVAAMLAVIFFGLVFAAKATGHWRANIPRAMYMYLVPHANEATHPGM